MVLSQPFLFVYDAHCLKLEGEMYISVFVSVDKGKILVPWTIVNLDDTQDCTFEELFGKVKVGYNLNHSLVTTMS